MFRPHLRGKTIRAGFRGAWSTRLLVLVAVFVMVAQGPFAPASHAAQPGLIMVICSDGVEKTVVIDSAGNPMPASEHEDCDWACRRCVVSQSDSGLPAVWFRADPTSPTTEALSDGGSTVRATRRWQHCAPRGPPSEDDA